MRQIGLTNLALVVILLAAALVLILTGHDAEGQTILGTALGVVVGGGVTTAVVQIKQGDPPADAPAAGPKP